MTPRSRKPGDGGSTPGDGPGKKPSQKHGKIDAGKDVTKAQDTTGEVAKAGRAGNGSGKPTGTDPSTRPHLSQEKFDEVVNTPKGQRPDPKTYLSQADIDAHLQPFREHGAVRVTSRAGIDEYGTIGPKDGAFVMPANEFRGLVQRSGGDLSKVEQELGLAPGSLTDGSSVAAYIAPEDLHNLRMPSGNEAGANPQWIPGGYTSGGVPEATADTPEDLPYEEIDL